MRSLSLLLTAAAVASCSTAPPQPVPMTPQAEFQLQRLIGERVAGTAVSCIPQYRSDNFYAINRDTVAFRSGGTVYVNKLNGPCPHLGVPGYAFLTRQPGGTSLCSGQIAEIVDTSSGMTVGSCALGDFIPYARR